jgi:hypothetical protein
MNAEIATAVCVGVFNENSGLEIFNFATIINDDNNGLFTSVASYVYRFGSGRKECSFTFSPGAHMHARTQRVSRTGGHAEARGFHKSNNCMDFPCRLSKKVTMAFCSAVR